MSVKPMSVKPGILLVGIHGKAKAGKDTVAQYLCNRYENAYTEAFAGPLKKAAAELFGVDIDCFFDEAVKETTNPYWNVTYRHMLQFFGTEVVRTTMGTDFWIKRLEGEINGNLGGEEYCDGSIVVIPDVRFDNEYDWILQNGGVCIHLVRPQDSEVGIPGHASEAGIDTSMMYRIDNNGTVKELHEKVDRAIDELKLRDKFILWSNNSFPPLSNLS